MICSLGEAGCTGAVENAVHKWTSDGKPEDSLLCCHHDSGSFSSDIFRTLGCQWVEAEYKRAQRGKGLQKNILITNHVSENIFKMTIPHVQWWLWSACGDLLMQWCGLSLARMRMKRTSFLSYQSWRTAACSFQKIQVRHERRAVGMLELLHNPEGLKQNKIIATKIHPGSPHCIGMFLLQVPVWPWTCLLHVVWKDVFC